MVQNIDSVVKRMEHVHHVLKLEDPLKFGDREYDSPRHWFESLVGSDQQSFIFDDYAKWIQSLPQELTQSQVDELQLAWGSLMLFDVKHSDIAECINKMQVETLKVDLKFGAELVVASYYQTEPRLIQKVDDTGKTEFLGENVFNIKQMPVDGMDTNAEKKKHYVSWLESIDDTFNYSAMSLDVLKGILLENAEHQKYYIFSESKHISHSFLNDEHERRDLQENLKLTVIIVNDSGEDRKEIYLSSNEGYLLAKTKRVFDLLESRKIDNNHECMAVKEEERKLVRIFLASSKELEADRKDFSLCMFEKNRVLKSRNIELEVVRWEELSKAMSLSRSQDDYNKHIPVCDFFVGLIHTKVGKYTREEFNTAWEAFKSSGKPKLFLYFREYDPARDGFDEANNETLVLFKKELRDGYEYFHCNYKDSNQLNSEFYNEIEKYTANL